MSRLTLIFNTLRGAQSIYDLYLTHPPRTEHELLQLPLIQYSEFVRCLGDVPTCLKHKHASVLVSTLPQVHKLVKQCDAPPIPLKTPSLLHTFALASQWCERMLRAQGKLLSVRKARRIIEKHWVSDNVPDNVLNLVRNVFREPIPPGIEPLAVLDYVHTRVQPQNQITPKQVLEVMETMANDHERARRLFTFASRWARCRLPDQPLFACIPDANSLWNMLAIFMNGNCNLQEILNMQ